MRRACATRCSLLSEAAFLEVKRQQVAGSDDVVPLGEWRALARSLGA